LKAAIALQVKLATQKKLGNTLDFHKIFLINTITKTMQARLWKFNTRTQQTLALIAWCAVCATLKFVTER
jgi:hypothetical protein